MSDDLTTLPLGELTTRCHAERTSFRTQGQRTSPACVAIFRRAFAGDQDAWTFIRTTYEAQVQAWVRAYPHFPTADIDDVIQNVFTAFFTRVVDQRYAYLHTTDDLALILDFLKYGVKIQYSQALRTQARAHLYALDEQWEEVAAHDPVDQQVQYTALLERVRALTTDLEYLIFYCRFVLNMPPRDILATYHDRLTDMQQVRQLIQTTKRRLVNDPIMREFHDQVSAIRPNRPAVGVLHDEQARVIGGTMSTPCELDESVLLDYVTGVATADERVLIEQSPACLAVVQRLRAEVLPLMQALFRRECPPSATLVAYQEGRLDQTDHLLVARHVTACPACQAECHVLAAIDAVPLMPEGGLGPRLRAWVTAHWQPALELQLLGGTVHYYHTPHLVIALSTARSPVQPHHWSLMGEVRTHAGLRLSTYLTSVALVPHAAPAAPPLGGTIDADGSFTWTDLTVGSYQVQLHTVTDVVIIPQVSIGPAELGA